MNATPTKIMVLSAIAGFVTFVVKVATLSEGDLGKARVHETPDEDPRGDA